MFKIIRRHLVSVLFHGVGGGNHRTRLLNIILWQCIITISFYGIAGLSLGIIGAYTALVIGTILFSSALAYVLMRKGRDVFASTVFVIVLWFSVTFTLIFYGGLKTQIFIAYVIVVLIAALLLSERMAILVAVMSVGAGIFVFYLEVTDSLPVPLEEFTLSRGMLLAGASILYLTMLLILFTRNLHLALRQAQIEIAERRRVEVILREGEERYRNLFSRIPVGLYRTTPQGKILDANPALMEMFGFSSSDDFVAINVADFYVDIDDRKELHHRLAQTDDVYRMESRFLRWDGEVIWGEDISRAVRDEEGNVIYYEGSLRNITDRKQAEQALYESEERYRLLAENAIDMISKHDMEGRYLYVSPACQQLLDYSPDELIGKRAYDLIHPDDAERIEAARKAVVEQSITEMVSYRIQRKGGEYIWVETTSKTFIDPKTGATSEILAITRNITERKKAEDSLRASEQHLRTLMDQAPVAIMTIDMQGRVTDVNPLVLEMTASPSREETLGLNLLELPTIKAAGVDAVIQEVIKDGSMQDIEIAYTSNWGRTSHLRARLAPLHNAAGEQIGVIQIAEDISERKKIEADLRASEEKYRMLFNTMLNGFALHEIITDEEGQPVDYRFLEVNPAFEEIIGLKSENIVGKSALEILPDLEPVWIRKYGQVALGGEPVRFVDFSHELGRHFEVFAYSPQYAQFAVVVTDVTDRIVAEEALRESQQMLRLILDHIPEAVFWKDENSVYLGCNRAFAKDFGYASPAQVIGKSDSDFEWLEQADRYRVDDREVIESGRAKLNDEEVLTIADGNRIWVYTSKVPLRDADDNVVGVLGVYQNITKQKQAADEIKRERDLANALMEASWAVNSSLDFDRVLEHILEQINKVIPSDTATIMLIEGDYAHVHSWRGHDRFGAVQVVENLVLHIPDLPNLMQIIETKKPLFIKDTHSYQGWKQLPDLKWIRSLLSAPLLVKDQVVGFLNLDGTATDAFSENQIDAFTAFAGQVALAIENAQLYRELSEYAEQLETRVRERTQELEEANDEMEAFTYTVSHDLRSPLRAIDGFSRIILDDFGGQLDVEVIRYLNLVRNNTRQMSELIDDLLNFSRLTRQTLSRRKVELNSLVEEIFREMILEYDDREVEVILGNLPDCNADPVLLKLVFQNLIGNALKFTRKRDNAKIEINCKEIEGEKAYFIRDNGVGFDLKYANKLFGVFQRLHSSADYEGTGVGLAIVHRIVQRHGGRVWVEAEEGKGATFYFTLGGGR